MSEPSANLVSHPLRLHHLAQQLPDEVVITFVAADGAESTITYAELDDPATRLAHLLRSRGVDDNSYVVIGLPNSIEHFVATFAIWKLGACVLPISAKAPPAERDAMIEVAQPAAVIATWDGPDVVTMADLQDLSAWPADQLPDIWPCPAKAMGSGGSTGRPKLIVDVNPWARDPDTLEPIFAQVDFQPTYRQLVVGPLYHNMPWGWAHIGIFNGQRLVVMERFDAERTVELVERHAIDYIVFVPTMMARIAKLEGLDPDRLRRLKGVFHAAAPCPPWVKRWWIDVVGPTRVHEGMGATDNVGISIVRGDEWLEHPGTVGKPFKTLVKIVDEEGNELPPGEVGEIFMKWEDTDEDQFRYVGAPPAKAIEGGYKSNGDMGWLDEEGYLYVADRRVDLVITGGANVYPAEVEAALSSHPGVGDVVVVGLPDADLGRRVHALIEVPPAGPKPSEEELRAHCKSLLAPFKCPRTYEFVTQLPRNEAGKIRRTAIVAERSGEGLPG